MATQIDRAALLGRWIHSHEEDTADLQVYRPAAFAFPPARGRDAMSLEADGSVSKTGPGPDDRSGPGSAGSWILRGQELTVDHGAGAAMRFRIEELTPDKLLLRQL